MFAAGGLPPQQAANQQQRQGPPPGMPPPPPMGGQPPAPGNVKSLRHRPSQAHIYGQTSPQAFSPPAVSNYASQSPQHSFHLPPPENSFGHISPVPSSAQMSFGQPSPQQPAGFPPSQATYGQAQTFPPAQSPMPPAPASYGQQQPANYGMQSGQNGYNQPSPQAPTLSPPAPQEYSQYQQDGVDGFGGSQVSFDINGGSVSTQSYGDGGQSNPPYGEHFNSYGNAPQNPPQSYADGAQYQSYGAESGDAGFGASSHAPDGPLAHNSYEQQSSSQPPELSSSAPQEFSQYQQNTFDGFGGSQVSYGGNEDLAAGHAYGGGQQHYQSYGAEPPHPQSYADGTQYQSYGAESANNADSNAIGGEENKQYPPYQPTEPNGFGATHNPLVGNEGLAAQPYGHEEQPYGDQYQYYNAELSNGQDTHRIHTDIVHYNPHATDSVDTGMEDDGGAYRVETITTTVCATCTWTLRNFMNDLEEKMVSLPFGPANWQYQLVFYPRGTGDGDDYASIYVRPLKSEKELLDGDNWSRPVTSFEIKIPRPIPNAPPGRNFSPDEAYIVSTKSEPTLVGFNSTTTGWGFPEMLERSLLPEAVASDGTLYIDARLLGDIVVEWTVYRWQWELPPLQELTEAVTYSRPFGPVDHKWRLRIHPHGTKKGESTHVSAYLEVVKSKNEKALGRAWSRPIVCLSMKVFAGSATDPLSTPALTGGWVFQDDNKDDIGWDTLVAIDKVNQSGDGRFSIVTEVTWDPSHDAAETDLGKVKNALADTAEDAKATKELRSELESIQEEKQQCEEQLERTQNRLKTLGDIEARMALMQKDIVAAHKRAEEADAIEDRFSMARDELAVAREAQDQADSLKSRVAEARARLAALRMGMEEGAEMHVQSVPGSVDSETPETLKAELLRANAKALELEKELVSLRADADAKARALTDAALRAPFGDHDDSEAMQAIADPEKPLMERVQLVRNEILLARGILLEIEERPVETAAARASLGAELAMAQADLEVIRATFIGLSAQYAHEIDADPDLAIEVDIVFGELRDARAQMASKRQSLEDPDEMENAEIPAMITHQDRATSPIRLLVHQPLPQVPQFTPSDFGMASVLTRDGSHAVPLPAGVPPPPTALDVYSQPVPSTNLQQQAANHHLVLRAQEEAAAAQQELASLRYERDAVAAELEETRQRMLDAREVLVNSRANGGPQIDTHSVMETLFGRRMSLGSNAPMQPEANVEAEAWTPVGKHAAGVSGKELSARLSQLGQSQPLGLLPTLLSMLVTLLTIWFILYSTVYVACSSTHLANNPKAVYRDACETRILPAWDHALNYWHGATNQVVGHWHGAAERFVFDIAPGMEKGFKAGIKKGRKAVKQAKQRVADFTAARAAQQAARESENKAQAAEQASSDAIREETTAVASGPPSHADTSRKNENATVADNAQHQSEDAVPKEEDAGAGDKDAEAHVSESVPGRDGSPYRRTRLSYKDIANTKIRPQDPHPLADEDRSETGQAEQFDSKAPHVDLPKDEALVPPAKEAAPQHKTDTESPPSQERGQSQHMPAPPLRDSAHAEPPAESNAASTSAVYEDTDTIQETPGLSNAARSKHAPVKDGEEDDRATEAAQPPLQANKSEAEESAPTTSSSLAADVTLSDPPPATANSDHHAAAAAPTHPHDLSPTAPNGQAPDMDSKSADSEPAGLGDPVAALTDLADAPPHAARGSETTAPSSVVDAPTVEAAVSAPQPAETESSAGWRETLKRSAAAVNHPEAAVEQDVADGEDNAGGDKPVDSSTPAAIPDLPLPDSADLRKPIADTAEASPSSEHVTDNHREEAAAGHEESGHHSNANSDKYWEDEHGSPDQPDHSDKVGNDQTHEQPDKGYHDEL
ncbi:hypothetical protein BDZ88DRAFT_505322 [Geranomyces variabilis]|nr:hypothetical protein BDZ88DRAFT_505322 [Geranomyces variabilis]KAJ3137996.1 hypothetical protein HDU90_001472 [Geranomyces variabilis]